jgi:hypothetical protein
MINGNNKPQSNLGFFLAMLVVVALGGGAYLYFDSTVFGPIEMQEQTAQQNPGVPHPPKDKLNARHERLEARRAASVTPIEGSTDSK